MSDVLKAALSYATRGWRVLPLWGIDDTGRCLCGKAKCGSPGKHPIAHLVREGVKEASCSPAQVERWWKLFPTANVGIATGPESDLYVIDVDTTKGGQDSIEELRAKFAFPPTVAARTGSGGYHLFYAYFDDLPNTTNKLGKGIDTRGEGGYVVAPPSIHRTQRLYEWITSPDDIPVAPTPDWVIDICERKAPLPPAPRKVEDRGDAYDRARRYLAKVPPAVSGAGGHDQTYKAALAVVKGFCLSEAEAASLLLQEYNPRCEPPWDEKDILRKVSEVAKAKAVPDGYLLDAAGYQERRRPPHQPSQVRREERELFGPAEEPEEQAPSPPSEPPSDLPERPLSSVPDPGEAAVVETGTTIPVIEPPEGYLVDDEGTWRELKTTTRLISHTPLWIDGVVVNSSTEEHFARLGWRDHLGRRRSRSVPLEDMSSRRRLEGYSRWGIHITQETSKYVVDYLTKSYHLNFARLPRANAASEQGWFDRRRFLWGLSVIDREGITDTADKPPAEWKKSTVIFTPSSHNMRRLATSFHAKGSFDLWREVVGERCTTTESKILLLAALGTPMLTVMGWAGVNIANFIVDLAGRTSSGKTTALRVAASAWGDPGEGGDGDPIVGTWGSTLAYVERVAAVRHNLPLILDDTKRARFGVVPKVVYMVANGQGDGRATIDDLQAKKQFRTILISTGESSATSLSQDGGTRVRALVLHGAPFGQPSQETADQIRDLMKVVHSNYGHAGPMFVRWVLENIHRLPSWVEQYEAFVMEHRIGAGASGPLNRVAPFLAFFDLVETLAHQAGVLPWEPGEKSLITGETYEDIAEGVQDADRPKDAIHYVVARASSLRSQFYDHYKPAKAVPHDGWIGRWDSEPGEGVVRRGRPFTGVAIYRHVLVRWLETMKFDVEGTIRAWRADGHLRLEPANPKQFEMQVRIDNIRNRAVVLQEDLFQRGPLTEDPDEGEEWEPYQAPLWNDDD